LQEFQLKQAPLTYVSAATPNGIEGALQVRVNDILWHPAPNLASLGPNDRSYLTRTGDDSKTTVVFGNGIRGARIPTGVENVKADYRTGIGKPGNVNAEQISLLSTKPHSVKAVINPIRASGGADRESRDSARRNTPLAVMSLDRLVSVQDYADFARSFAGVAKACAAEIGNRVHVTIAGADGAPIDESSDVFVNLLAAFGKFGDPQQPMQLAVYHPMFLVIQAKIAILPDYQFEAVAPRIRDTLLAAFAFDNRDLGQDVLESEIIAAMQGIEGVQYVDLDTLDVITSDLLPLPTAPPTRTRKRIHVLPAQLAFLTPEISETLILTELADAR
jgi:predicted phage baseplate assembly protein